jgi:hypothetical protein
MFKKLLFLSILSFTLTSAADAELVGWWKFDETSGSTAADSSGNGNDGTLNGSATWAPEQGKRGGALEMDGSAGGYVFIPNGGELTLINQGDFTITMWFRQDVVSGIANLLQQTDENGTGRTLLLADAADGIRTFLGGTSTLSGIIEEPGVWYHVAMVVTEGGSADTIEFYINGQQEGTPAQVDGEDSEGDFLIGTNKGLDGRWVDGLVDDLRLYNHALSQAEILKLALGPKASKPVPADGANLEATWANVSWTQGRDAVSHDVYIGESFEDVNSGAETVFQGNQADTSLVVGFPGFPLPGGLIPGTTYYWRIDEVNQADPNSPWIGDVWSFTIPPKKAYAPTPADGAKNVLDNVTLSWTAGFGAILNNVYFGDDFDDVNDAEGAVGQMDTTYVPGALEMDKTYYWRVDEFDGAVTHRGDVWSFTTVPDIAVTDQNLMLWWTLDEGEGSTAVDFSGHGNHGAIFGDATWVDGYQGTALTFGQDVYVEAPEYNGVTGTAARTCCAWIRSMGAGNRNIMSWGENVAGQKWRMRIDVTAGLRIDVNGGYHYGVTNISDGLWHHVAVTFEDDGSPDVLDTILYVDGEPDVTLASLDEPIDTGTGPVRIGESPWHNAPFLDQIDDARIYDRVLTADEVRQVMLGDTALAGDPVPARHALIDIRDMDALSWSAGDAAVSHDVYFGTNRDAVAGADNDSPQFQGNQAGTSLAVDLVEFGGGDYYWRVDEVQSDGTVIAGTIWKFTVPDYLIVDNFESYDNVDPEPGEPGVNRIFDKWIDGFGTLTNGALVGNDLPPYAETGTVHSGSQSLVYRYDNAGKTSEATLTLTKRDWTAEGVTKLSLWLRGDSANAADRVYVALNGTAVVYHDDPAATQITGWREWVIDLATFGVDLTNVNSITIGIGTKNAPAPAGGQGTMHFDDIRLIR